MATAGTKPVACNLLEVGPLKLEEARDYPVYNSIKVLSADMMVIIDFAVYTVRLHSHNDGNLLASSVTLTSEPWDICVMDDGRGIQVAVTVDYGQIEILLIELTDQPAAIRWVRTLDVQSKLKACEGVRALRSQGKLVVSGLQESKNKQKSWYCWGLVSIVDGHVGTVHTICNYRGYGSSYLVTSPDDSMVYISCWTDSSDTGVYAFDITGGQQKFVYSHSELTHPMGVSVDGRGYIYVCNWNPPSIHQLTDRGEPVTVHIKGMPQLPRAMDWNENQGKFYVTSHGSHNVWRFHPLWSDQQDTGIPAEILNMDDRSIQLFEEALKDGTENVHSLRIMVVGHSGVGKTTLIKRLLGQDVNISENCSTEGIDVHVHCCDISMTTNEWTQQKQDSEQDYQLKRLARVLNEIYSTKNKVTDKEQIVMSPKGEKTLDSSEGANVAVKTKDTEAPHNYLSAQQDHNLSSTEGGQEESSSVADQGIQHAQSDTNTMVRSELGEHFVTGSYKMDSLREMLKLLQENAKKLRQDTDRYAPLTMWDFAGQYAFYTTHQMFLTRRAIYLLVLDVSRQGTELVEDDCFFDNEGIMKCKIHELIEVWLNLIHSCAPSPEGGIPPVILVGTHVDTISKDQKVSPAKETELSETQIATVQRVEIIQPTTPEPAAGGKEKPKTSSFLGSVQSLFKPQKAQERGEANPVPSIIDQPKTQRKVRLWPWRKKRPVPSAVKPVVERIVDDDTRKSCYEICEGYFREIRSNLRDKPTRFHLADQDFVIDNTVIDAKLEDLKKKIVEVALQQPYWGEKIPARWLPLEQELMKLRNAGVKLMTTSIFGYEHTALPRIMKLGAWKNLLPKEVITRSLVEDLNQAGAVQISKDELDLFLRFQHDIGTILYFSLDVLKEKIVLDPQWLISALKSLITAEMFVLRYTPAVSKKWFEFKESGKLSEELIDALWTRENNPDLHDNKEHILLLMEQLNIIAKPRSYRDDASDIKVEDYFLAPCMLSKSTPKEVISPKPNPEMESSSVLCYVFIGRFLPSPIFHRLLAACVAHWPIAKKKSADQIFCGCCIFDLDIQHRLTILFRDYVIFARISRIGKTDKCPSSKLCIEVRKFVTSTLSKVIGYLGQSLRFELSIQCPKSDGYSADCLIPVSYLKKNEEVPCHFHDNSHVIMSHEVLKFWFQEEDTPFISQGSEEGGVSVSPQLPNQQDEKPSERQLGRVSLKIGREFYRLGLELGLSEANIQQIQDNYPDMATTSLMILVKWKQQNMDRATFRNLEEAFKVVGIDIDIIDSVNTAENRVACLPSEMLDKHPEDRHLCQICGRVGKEYVHMGVELGVPVSRIEQIRIEHPYDVQGQCLKIMREWTQKQAKQATFRNLEQAFTCVGIDPSFLKQCVE